jgi:hypothetical protein
MNVANSAPRVVRLVDGQIESVQEG